MKTLRAQWLAKRAPPASSGELPVSGSIVVTAVRQLDIGGAALQVEQVAVGFARTRMPGLIRASAESGRVFLIENARSPSAASALLVNPEVLGRTIAAARLRRTLGDIVDALPFKRRGAPRLTIEMPDAEATVLRVPGQSASAAGPAERRGDREAAI
jgi:hypothetical protein